MKPRDILDAIASLPALHTEAYERARLRGADYRSFVAQEEAKLLQEYAQKGQVFVTEIFEEVALPDGAREVAPPVKCGACRRPYLRGYMRIADPRSGTEFEISYEALHGIELHKNLDHDLVQRLEEILGNANART